MNLQCNPALGDGHTSSSQRVKKITEGWFTAHGYCLNCASMRVRPTVPGTKFRDHVCPACTQGYEMKSSREAHEKTVPDGGYDSMMKEILRENPPALMLLQYDTGWCVHRLFAVHPVFLTPKVIRKRGNPHYRPVTRKEYWMCDFDLTVIPADGKIPVVVDGVARHEEDVRADFQRSKIFEEIPLESRGWTALVLAYVRKLGKRDFTTGDMRQYEEAMHAVYPENSHVREKIRQQLQVLEALGYVERVSRGEYRLIK